ncbi:MAG TPA: DUF3082 domain-containing protein [Cyanobacteria bacterium UBA8156]|jgi:hypothetical protein|nr:DUF3082 domain-containing protein [Cyanobacteria bacterium UBA8156]
MSETENPVGPFRSWVGAAIAGGLGLFFYGFFQLLAGQFAVAKVLPNPLANRLAALVRSALLAVAAGGTMVFGIIALGLVLLGLQKVLMGDRQNPQA